LFKCKNEMTEFSARGGSGKGRALLDDVECRANAVTADAARPMNSNG
jgi:hypothetical protein